MSQRTLKQKKWGWLFLALFLLLISQVLWWAIVFCRDVNVIQQLKTQVHQLSSQLGLKGMGTVELFFVEANRQKTMFISESIFFALVASLALWLLFRALKREEKTLKTQRDFIEVISHESKTPLTALKLRLESVREKSIDKVVKDDLNRALEEVRRLSGILQKALELNRVEMFSYNKDVFDLGDLTSQLLKRMEPVFNQKEVEVESILEPDLLVHGDAFGIQNTIQSVIENGVHYNDSPHKKLTIRVTKEHNQAIVSVSDNGPGITEKEESFIFDKFFRGKAGRKVPGTGLGLYLAKQIVSNHYGVLKLVKSTVGAQFEIRLPLKTGVS